ncbi:MAG TPA: hypothetical protein VGE92_07395 [Steroidobacteraceae bacterium]
MRTKLKLADAAAALTRLLEAFERELIESSDEEIMQAAQDLGMNPQMKGSAAFAGLKYRSRLRLADFYDLDLNTSPQPRLTQRPQIKDRDDN